MGRPYPKARCCPHFTDYFDPNEWYTLFCNWGDGGLVGYANSNFSTVAGWRYYWDSGLDTLLNGTMINYQWSPSDLTTATSTWTYSRPYDFVSDFSRTIYTVVFNFGDPVPLEADYTAHTVNFTGNRLRLVISDTCTGIPSTTNVAGKFARRFTFDWFATISSPTLTISQNASVASPYNGRSRLILTGTSPLTSPTNDDTVEMWHQNSGSSRNTMITTLGNFALPLNLPTSTPGAKTSKSSGMTC